LSSTHFIHLPPYDCQPIYETIQKERVMPSHKSKQSTKQNQTSPIYKKQIIQRLTTNKSKAHMEEHPTGRKPSVL